jgi:hypothetical protein
MSNIRIIHYLEHRMTIFFSCLTEYFRIWRNYIFWSYAHIWQYLATSGLKNIDKYWKHIEKYENILKSCKVGQY